MGCGSDLGLLRLGHFSGNVRAPIESPPIAVLMLTALLPVGTWFAFTYLFRRRAIKLERTNLNYGALARLTRDGGFWVGAPPPSPSSYVADIL